jgi:hypothetical protein
MVSSPHPLPRVTALHRSQCYFWSQNSCHLEPAHHPSANTQKSELGNCSLTICTLWSKDQCVFQSRSREAGRAQLQTTANHGGQEETLSHGGQPWLDPGCFVTLLSSLRFHLSSLGHNFLVCPRESPELFLKDLLF